MEKENFLKLKPGHGAHNARAVGAWIQLGFFIALFVLWCVVGWPLARAAELCVVGGMLFYSALNIYAALTGAWSGPVLAARISRFVGVILFVVMRYVFHYGFFALYLVWLALWILAAFLVRRSRRRAISASPLRVSPLQS